MEFDFSPVESLDKVPEQFRTLYQDQAVDGKYIVNPAHAKVVEGVIGFNKSNKALREQIKGFKPTDLSPLAEYGQTPEEIAAAVKTKLTEAGGAKGQEIAKQVEAAKQGLVTAHQTELKKRDERNTALQTQLYTLMVENAATAAVAEAKGVPELLLPFIKNQVKVAEENGAFIVQVVDGKGEVRYGATGSPMTIKELVQEMKGQEKYGRLFESEHQQGGSGMPPGGGRRPTGGTGGGKELTANEKIAKGLSQGQYRRQGRASA